MELYIEHVDKAYGDVQAIQDATCKISGKHFVVLAGPSGCGKSTLLHLIAGFLSCDQGTIWMDGNNVASYTPAQRNIAMVFQDAALFPHMRVYENIVIGLAHSGLSQATIAKRVNEVCARLKIEDLMQRKAKTLSNGQKQRVSIARALVRRPKLFLMDEPLSALDARLKSQLRMDIAALYQKMDATFLYVTHDQVEAMTLADTLLLMKEGRLQQVDTPMQLYQDPCNLFVATFLGTYDSNQFNGRIQDQDLLVCGQRLRLPKQIANQDIVVSVRPELIKCDTTSTICGEIVFIENLGNEIYYHIQWQDRILLMKGNVDHPLSLHASLHISFSLEKAFYFRSEDHTRLYIWEATK